MVVKVSGFRVAVRRKQNHPPDWPDWPRTELELSALVALTRRRARSASFSASQGSQGTSPSPSSTSMPSVDAAPRGGSPFSPSFFSPAAWQNRRKNEQVLVSL